VRTITAIATLTGTLMIPVVGFFNIPAAQADSLTAKESAYVIAYGAGAICPTLDKNHSIPGVVGVVEGVMSDGFSAESAVNIVNASVANFCDRNWELLQRTGAAFRAADKGGQLV